MLDPWIIAEIRKREEDRLRDAETAIERPAEEDSRTSRRGDDVGEEPRGVTIVDYTL